MPPDRGHRVSKSTAPGRLYVVQVGHRLAWAAPRRAGAAEVVPVASEQPLVLGVGHRIDPVPQGLTVRSGEQRFEQPSVLQREDLPAGRAEHAGQPGAGDQRHHPVQRLTIEVDDPDDLAEFGTPWSTMASQTAPSSSSASPSSQYWRPGCRR